MEINAVERLTGMFKGIWQRLLDESECVHASHRSCVDDSLNAVSRRLCILWVIPADLECHRSDVLQTKRSTESGLRGITQETGNALAHVFIKGRCALAWNIEGKGRPSVVFL